MKQIKIIHLITRLDKGGSAENTFLSAREFLKKGYAVQVWTGEKFDLPREIEEEARLIRLPLVFIPSLVRSIRPLKEVIALRYIIRMLKKEKPDILHVHTSKAGVLGRLAGYLTKVPVVIYTPHGHIFYGYFGPIKTKIFILIERWMAKWTDAIIPLTQRGVEEHLNQKIGRRDQYHPIASGIDLAALPYSESLRQELRKKFKLSKKTCVVGSAGRFALIKGFDLIVEAAPKVLEVFPSVLFYLAGIGPLKEKLRQRVVQLGIDKQFIFDDFQEVVKPLHLIDIFLLPSRNEGQSRTLVEAMYYKKPVIAASVGGVPDVVEHGVTGLLVPSNDAASLADAVIELLQHRDQAKQLGEKAHQEVLDRFNLNEMIVQLENLYLNLLKKK